MQFVTHDGKLVIARTAGYTPHIGVLVATMQRCRDTTIRLVQDLTTAQLDYLFDDQDNSIGGALTHPRPSHQPVNDAHLGRLFDAPIVGNAHMSNLVANGGE